MPEINCFRTCGLYFFNRYGQVDLHRKNKNNCQNQTNKLYCNEVCHKANVWSVIPKYKSMEIEALKTDFSEWSEWSECHLKCSGGKRSRFRFCKLLNVGLNKLACYGDLVQHEGKIFGLVDFVID